jgi:glycogen(starch) synthase
MRVLCWADTFWPKIGGAEVFVAKLLPALQERGYQFIVVTRQDSPDLPQETLFEGIPVYRLPFYTELVGNNIAPLLALRQQVAELKRNFAPDLVHANNLGPGIFFHIATAKAHPAPLLLTLHGVRHKLIIERGAQQSLTPQEVRYRHALERDSILDKAFRSANWITCVSESLLADTRQFVPEITPYSSVIYNGVKEPSLPPTPLPFTPPQLLCLGRLAPYKGFDLALTAFASITARFPQARLIIAGDGPMQPELARQTVELGLTQVVDFVGWVSPDKVPALINTATVVVMPSWGEGFPLVALEAALMARPVVGTQVRGLVEILRHQETGLLINKDDSTGLAAAFSFLLEHPEVATQMGQAARQHVQEVFSFARCIEAYDALYQKLIQEWRSARKG